MKPLKQIPTRLKIDVLIIIVGLGVIALGIVITTARILGTSVQEYARLIPFLAGTHLARTQPFISKPF